jgi:MFS family permease
MDTTHPHEGRQLLTCCAIGLCCFFASYMRIPVLPLFAASLGATTPQVGMINATFMLSAGVLAIPSGLLADRLGQRPVLLGGLLVIAGSSLLLAASRAPWQMGVIYLLFGAGLAAFTPTMMAFVADATPRAHLGRAYGLYMSAVYSGMTFGPAAGGFCGRSIGLARVFLVSGTITFLVFVLAFLLVRPAAPRTSGQAPATPLPVRELLANRRLTACLTGTLGGCFGFGMFVSFLPLYAHGIGLNPGQIGIVFAAQALANALLRIPFGRLSDRVDRGHMAAAGLGLFSVALAILGLCTGLLPLTLCAAGLGLGMGIGFTALGALVAEVVPREQRGLALGLYNSCIYLGMMLSSAAMGVVIREAGYRAGFGIAAGVCLLATGIFFGSYRRAGNASTI